MLLDSEPEPVGAGCFFLFGSLEPELEPFEEKTEMGRSRLGKRNAK